MHSTKKWNYKKCAKAAILFFETFGFNFIIQLQIYKINM